MSIYHICDDFSFADRYAMKKAMEKIDPQKDHERLASYKPGGEVTFHGKVYVIQRRTTLASGEAAVVLQGEKEQFLISAGQFLAGVQPS
jgi:hypothetical protein